MTRPLLWHLPISHFSEKVRWALDSKRVPHRRRIMPPGLHPFGGLLLTGGKQYTMPVLEMDGRRIGDSTAIIAALEERFPEIRRAMVFGSLVHDRAVPGSDVDLLLVLKTSDRKFLDRPAKYRPDGFPVGLDIFAYTADEMEKMLDDGNFFVRRALREGKTLFERAQN